MTRREQKRQSKELQEDIKKDRAFPWRSLSIALIFIFGFLLLGLGCIWLLSRLGIIPSSWWRVTAPLFSLIGAFIGWIVNNVFNKDFFQEFNKWLFHHDEDNKSEASDNKAISAIIKQTPTIEQNPTLTFNPTIIIGSAVRQEPSASEHVNLSSSTPHLLSQAINSQSIKNASSSSGQFVAESEYLSLDPSTIFLFNEQLDTPNEFYGRALEKETLIGRTHRGQSTSIVGPRRIGKTWLISYLRLIAPTSSKLGLSYRIGYLNATSPSCANVAGFVAKALKALDIAITILNYEHLHLYLLEKAIEDIKLKNQIPILCIDEFEGLSNPENFDIKFFTGLRAIAQEGLGLITASKLPLIDMLSEYKTSPFFNIFEQITLKPFTLKEAETFIQKKAKQAGFTEKEQEYLLRYGQQKNESQDERRWPPLRLQLAGKTLLEDKQRSGIIESNYYRPDDLGYWWNFEKSLEEKYQAVVRI